MKVEQIYKLTNQVLQETVGETVVLEQDLSNVVDVGKAVFGATEVDNYVKSLVNHIGKVIFVNRPYHGNAPSVLMDGWEFGSVLQKVKAELPEATVNESWNLEAGKSYDPNVFNPPTVSSKFYNSKTTFEIDMSFTEMQVKESFSSAEQLNGFLSMLTSNVEKSLSIRLDGLIRSTIASMIGDTIFDSFGTEPITGKTSTRVVNLLKLYQDEIDNSLTDPVVALRNPEFIRYAVMKIIQYKARLSNASRLFNMGGNVRFTSDDRLHLILLSDFKSAADVYLQSDTYHNEFTALPNAETIPFWQGTGTDYNFNSTSSIEVVTGSGHAVKASGILGVMFDREALGVSNLNRRVTTHYNPRAEFFNNFYKADGSYFTDGDENFVVFVAQ